MVLSAAMLEIRAHDKGTPEVRIKKDQSVKSNLEIYYPCLKGASFCLVFLPLFCSCIVREHYQWNMDIWGVQGVEAEAELLSAIVTSFKDMGIGPEDVGIKINSRKILTGLMGSLGVPEDKFAPTCVLIDKLEKIPLDAIQGDLKELGLTREVVEELVSSLQVLSPHYVPPFLIFFVMDV